MPPRQRAASVAAAAPVVPVAAAAAHDFFLERLPYPSRGGVNRGVPPDPLSLLFFSACGEPSFRT